MHSELLESIRLQIEAIERMKKQFSYAQCEILMQLISEQSGQLIFTGMGKSGYIAKKIASSIRSIGVSSNFLHPAEAMHGDIGPLTEQDLVFLISNSGETPEVLALQHQLKKRNIKTISLTRNHSNSIASQSDLNLIAGSTIEADHCGILPTSSTTCALVMGDLITIAIAKNHRLTKSIFAQHHPHGNIGLNTLKPVYTQVTSVPILSKNLSLKAVLSELLSGHRGCVLIGQDNHFEGLITEGDLNRAISQHPTNWQTMKAIDIMTLNPVTLTKDYTVHDAEDLMIQHRINSIIILANENTKECLGVYTRIYRK